MLYRIHTLLDTIGLHFEFNSPAFRAFEVVKCVTAADYWKEQKTVLFQTIQGMYAYEIVSVMKVDVTMFPFQQVDFEGDTSLETYIKQAESLGLFGMGVLCDNLEPVLTLVTCSYEWESARNVVVAVRKAEVPVD